MNHLNKPQPLALVNNTGKSSNLQRGLYTGIPYGIEYDDDSSESGLLLYWRILCRHKGTILLSSIAGFLLGLAISIPMKPIYRTQTTLEVLTLNEDFMNLKQASPTTSNDGSYDTSEEQTQAKLLEGSAVLNRVIAKLDPDAHFSPEKPHIATSGWRAMFHLPDPIPRTPRQTLLAQAAASLKVRPTARTRVLEVTVECTDPQVATDFANTLTEQFIAMNVESRWATTQKTSEWLRRELDEARDKLRKSEDTLQAYAKSSGLIFTDETTNVATEKLQQVQQNLSAASADRIAKQSRYELAQNAPAASLADVLSDNSLRETQSKINDLKRQIADLTAVYSPEYSKVQRLQAELDSLQPAFNTQRSDIITRIKNDYTEASRREKLLLAAYQNQAQEVTGQDEKAIQYNILKRDVDSNRQLYDNMLQQMKQASISSAMRASNVRIGDPAEVPFNPIWPNFKLNAIIGLFGGLLLSIIVVTVRERADRTLQQPGDVKMWAEIPELAVIPSASIDNQKTLDYDRAALADGSSNGQSFALRKGSDAQPIELITWQKKPSLIAEAFRSALTSILFIGQEGSRPKVLVFTSANASDGKTTAVSNIAIAAAEIGMRVLVIDADLRRPRMHQLFNVSNENGLTDVLQSGGHGADPIDVVKKTSVPGLFVVTAGPPTNAAAHLLYSPHLASLITQMREEFDMIFIDTPPMMQMTDARVAGRLADAVVLVARSNKTTRDAMIAAKERFAEDNIRVLGAVLNDWNPKGSTSQYYDYYRSHYHKRPYSASAS